MKKNGVLDVVAGDTEKYYEYGIEVRVWWNKDHNPDWLDVKPCWVTREPVSHQAVRFLVAGYLEAGAKVVRWNANAGPNGQKYPNGYIGQGEYAPDFHERFYDFAALKEAMNG